MFWETIGIIIGSNFVTMIISLYSFRVKLERRLVMLEANVESIKNKLGI